MAFLSRRRRLPEIMDQPGLDPARHAHALRSLALINGLSGSAGILWRPLVRLARRTGAPLRVLDLAAGGGDVLVRLWRRARRRGVALRLEGCDASPFAVRYARQNAEKSGADVHYFEHDVLAGPLPFGYDVLMCSLFLHHLDDDEAHALLRRMGQQAGRMVLVNDLERAALGFTAAWVGTRLLSRSDVVHTDGPLSVRAAFTRAELRTLAERAGLAGARVAWRWPWRMLLTWERP